MSDKPEAPQEPKPKKKKAVEVTKAPATQLLHHIVRTIARSPIGTGGAHALADIEAYLADYAQNGWRLFGAHYLGEMPEGYVMLWILVKDQ